MTVGPQIKIMRALFLIVLLRSTMANSASAKKRAKTAENRRQRNASQRSMMRTYVKKLLSAIDDGNKESAQAAYKEVSPILDKSVTSGLISKNKAARQKSRLNKKVKAMA